MDFQTLLSGAYEIVSKSRHNNDTTGDTPIPEIPHRHGLEMITSAGERTLWITFAIMAASTVVFGIWSARQPRKTRLFPGQITMGITLCASIAYFSMATHTGRTLVSAPGHNAVREVFWARYADWAVTTPLLLLDCCLFAGLPLVDLLFLIVADIGMILTGLFSALDPNPKTRWGFYTFSCLFFLYILWVLLYTNAKAAYARSDKIGQAYIAVGVYTTLAWTFYPIVFAFGEGTNYISSDTEVLLYAILDVIAKPGFGVMLLALHSALPETSVSLSSFWTEGSGRASNGYGAISDSA